MVKRCCHGNCNSDIRYPERLQEGIKFVRFPSPKKNFEKLIRWLSLCGKSYSQVNLDKTRHRFLCTKHFVDKSGPTKEHPDPVQAPPYIPRKERNRLAREAKKSAQSKKGLKAVKSKTVAKDLCVKERHTSAGSSTCSTIQSKTASRDTMPPKKKPGSAQKGAMKKSGTARFQVDLMMECEDEELSPAQLKAMQQAQEDHDKANDLIKAARAGNTLVPSTKPNTFTLVPPKQPLAPPKVPLVAPSLAVPTSKNQSPANSAPASNVLVTKQPAMQQLTPQAPIIQKQLSEPAIQTPSGPPPRPQQYLNKHQQKKEDTSPDIMIIGESPPRPNSKILMNQNVQQHQIPAQPAKVTGVTPTQVYKFVSPHGTTTQIGSGAQWLIRPVLTVTPQQLQQQQGKQQIQQQAATSGNKVYFTTPPRGTNTKPDESAAAKKKSKKDSLVEIDSAGHWVPLDEYYYGTVDGDATYNEDKGEYRFKCWYCSKMLYNNVRAMQHIQAHIDSTKQLNIDLSDLTQCKHCYKQFDTPFEMQTHVEKVHLSNKVLMCRICEKDFGNTKDLIMHMRQNHLPCEMPYHCQLCGFRSSMYSDVVDHFKKKHDSSSNMLCLYCLRVFRIKFVSQGWGQTQTYYGHLLKHQAKSSMKKCNVCRLMFFNPLDVKNHRKNCHTSYKMDFKAMSMGQAADDQLMIKVTEGSPKGSGGPKKESKPKSLNAPSISKIQDYGGVSLPFATTTSRCIECKMTMSSTDHYKKHINCSLCRFATSCSVAYANHMMGFHSGQVTSLNLNIPWERPMKQIMFCSCGFSTKYGTKMANHLVFCGKHTCSGERPSIADTGGEKAKDEGKKEGGIFGALGLVQKKTVTTRVRTLDSGKSEPKSEWKMEKQSGQESKLTSLKQKTSPSPPVIAVDDFKSSILYVSKSKLDTGKDGQGDQQNVKEDIEHVEKGAIEGNKNDAENQLGINDKGDSTDVKKENSYEQDKVQAADVTIGESGKQNVEASEIKEESDELLNKDKLAEKVDTTLDKNEGEKSVDEHDEVQSTQQTVPEAIQLNSDTEEDNVKAKQLGDRPEGTEMIDMEGKHPSGKSDDNAEESDAQEAKKLDNDTEEDTVVAKEPLDKANGKKETDSETKQLSVETVEQIEDEIILLEEDMDKGDETSTLNTETQRTSENITDEEMADKIPATMDESEHTEAGDRTSHTEDTELMETDQVEEKENSLDEQQSTNEGSTAESGAFPTETEDVEMKDTADKEQEEPKESEVSQVKQTDPDMSVRSDVDNCRDVGEQQGDITAETETVTPTDVEVTEGSKDVATEDHPDKSEAKTEDSERDLDRNKPDETKQETSQIERPRQSSVDSQKSDRSDRSSQGQQENRSHSSGGHAYDERYRHGDRSRDRSHDRHQRDYHSGTQRSDDYRPYNRDRSHDRVYDEGHRDNRYGYDNRGGHGQSYRGHGGHRGQYGGHHYGNRGGYNQDRNYNRNYGNRGGYGGGYRGGYY